MLKLVSVCLGNGIARTDMRRLEMLAADSEFDVTRVVPTAGEARTEQQSNGLRIVHEPVRLRSVPHWGRRLQTYPRLGETLIAHQPDVIHVDGGPASLLALQVVRLRRRLLPNTAVVLETPQSGPEQLPWPARSVARRTLAQVDVLVARSREALEASRACGFTGQGMIVDYAVDRALYHHTNRAKSDIVRPQTAASGTLGLTVGFLGDLTIESGLIEVLEAVAACRSAVNLAIMGRGPIRFELGDRAKSLGIDGRVSFVDPAADSEAAFLNTVDVRLLMLHSGRDTPQRAARALVESQSCGVPVIASALVGIRDLVGRGGWLIAERDAGVLAHLLHTLVCNPAVLADASAACLAQAERRFSLDAVTHELGRAFQVARQNHITRKVRPVPAEMDRLGLQKQAKP